jgi:hypothetical protein
MKKLDFTTTMAVLFVVLILASLVVMLTVNKPLMSLSFAAGAICCICFVADAYEKSQLKKTYKDRR